MEHHDREGVAAFYVPDESFAPGVSASLGEGVLHHVRVRRLGIGSRVALLDGQGHRAEGTLVRLSKACLLYTSPRPRDRTRSRMPSSA